MNLPDMSQKPPTKEENLQTGLLRRLERLVRIQTDQWGELNDEGHRLVAHSIFETLGECEAAGLGDQAWDIVRRPDLNPKYQGQE